MQSITNRGDVPLALCVWLLHDDYDRRSEPNYISATSVMKPIRHIVLPSRVPSFLRTLPDVSDFTAARIGTGIHDGVEASWNDEAKRTRSLIQMGYPEEVARQIRINPTLEEVHASNEIIPIYMEIRLTREIDGYVVGGKFDFIGEGILQDNKSANVFSYQAGSRDDDYILQMSIYRWLDAGQRHRRISEDFGQINYVLVDWSKAESKRNPAYPQSRTPSKQFPLLSLADTEAWIRNKLSQITRYKDTPEKQIPFCTDVELWRSEPVHKYFSDPAKAQDPTARSSKNFADLADANRWLAEKGKGVVITKPGEPKRCEYCPAFDACTQKDAWFNA